VLVHPRGSPTTYRFNGIGALVSMTDALGQTTTYQRDATTNLIQSVTDPLGRVTSLTYDPANNVRTLTYEPTFNKVLTSRDPQTPWPARSLRLPHRLAASRIVWDHAQRGGDDVPTSPILFAMLSGVSAATWTVCLKLGSAGISAPLGAMVITAVAFVVNAGALLVMRAHGHEIVFQRPALGALAVAGIAAAGVDVFALLAYERGLRVTSSLIIGATSTTVVVLVGFLALREPFTAPRALAIALIVTGTLLLQAQGK
jgi:YD repeat-containing protein